jgi:hypothetical protein
MLTFVNAELVCGVYSRVRNGSNQYLVSVLSAFCAQIRNAKKLGPIPGRPIYREVSKKAEKRPNLKKWELIRYNGLIR